MSWLREVLTSTIGKKVVVAVTGLGLVLYLVLHLLGNLLIYFDPVTYNQYASELHELALLPVLEVLLLVAFLVHVIFVSWLIKGNSEARGQRYAVSGSKRDDRWRTAASKMMMLSGLVALLFIIVHIYDYRFQRLPAGGDLADKTSTLLAQPFHAALYFVGSLLIGWHIFHGISSAFRSFGVAHKKYTPIIRQGGFVLAAILGLGFASFPIWALIKSMAS